MSISPATTPFTGTQSGSFIGSRAGAGTFSRTVTSQGGTRTADTVFTLPNGQTLTRDVIFSKNETGWTRTVATTLPGGKTTALQETGTRQADGSDAVSGGFTDASGQTQAVSGTDRSEAGGSTSDLTFTNAAGQTRTQDATSYASADQLLRSVHGASFSGASFTGSNALTILQSQAAAAA